MHAVDGISFIIGRGETFGLVGESGCGKSTTGRAIFGLHRPTSGSVIFTMDLVKMQGDDLRKMRKKMQMIFQDPYSSLNPRMTVGDIIGEPLVIHNMATGKQAQERVEELLHWWALIRASPIGTRTNSPAASASASAWRARWP